MKVKYIVWVALGLILGNLVVWALPARATASLSVMADHDTYVYEGGPDSNYDGELDAGARVSFGNISGYQDIAYFHFPFTNQPAKFSSAIIYIYYDWCDTAFYANISLVQDNTWKENEITWNTRPAPGSILGAVGLVPPVDAPLNFSIDVTSYITGSDGISISIGMALLDFPGSARALTHEDAGDPSLGAYVPVLVWTYEEMSAWMYLLIGAAIMATSITIALIIKKRKSVRSVSILASNTSGILDKLKGLFKNSAEDVKENILGTSPQPQPAQPTNICFFEGDPKTKEFVRVFATLLSLEPHKLVVRINGEDYVYPCRYDLTRPMDRVGDILLFYAFAKEGQDVELYPLPVGSAEFNVETAGTLNFPRISDKERLDLIYAIPGVKEAEAEIARVQDSFLSGVRDVLDFAASQTRLGKYLPSLQSLLGKGLEIAGGSSTTPQVAEVGRVAVDIQPPKVDPSSKINILSAKDRKKLDKELSQNDKQREKYIRSLFKKG